VARGFPPDIPATVIAVVLYQPALKRKEGGVVKRLKYPKIWATMATILVVVAIAMLIVMILVFPSTKVEKNSRTTVSSQAIEPTELQQVRQWFGPWEMVSPDSTGAPALVMLLQSGATEVSTKTVVVDANWQDDDPPQIVGIGRQGSNFLVRLNGNQVFVVGDAQAFVLEREPLRVYAVLSDNQGGYVIKSIPTKQVYQASQGGQ
jgi:hypothetical protein